MITLFRSNRAFNRTAAHPLDSGVRIATCAEDFFAINNRKAKAVILKGSLSTGILRELNQVAEQIPYKFGEGHNFELYEAQTSGNHPNLSGNYSNLYGIERGFFESDSSFLKRALFTKAPYTSNHMRGLVHAFCHAHGIRYTKSQEQNLALFPLKTVYQNDQEYLNSSSQIQIENLGPHLDGYVDRVLCTYSTAPQTGTSWIPGNFSESEIKEIQTLYATSGNADQVLKDFNCQHLEPGDILAIKGYNKADRGVGELLLHKTTLAPAGIPRTAAVMTRRIDA